MRSKRRTWIAVGLCAAAVVAIIGLAVHQSAYSAEVMRSGLLAVDHVGEVAEVNRVHILLRRHVAPGGVKLGLR